MLSVARLPLQLHKTGYPNFQHQTLQASSFHSIPRGYPPWQFKKILSNCTAGSQVGLCRAKGMNAFQKVLRSSLLSDIAGSELQI